MESSSPNGFLELLETQVTLSNDARLAARRITTRRKWEKGTRLFQAGSICPALVYLVSGAVRSCTINDRQQEITYFLFFEGGLVTDYRSLITGEESRFDFKALENCVGDWVRGQDLFVLVNRHPELLQAAMRFSQQAYVTLDRRTESLMLDSPEARYRCFLTEFGDRAARVPHHVLSTWLGVRPESLSRIRKRIGLTRTILTHS